MHTASILAASLVLAPAVVAVAGPLVELTPAERAAGWVMLFDGSNTDAWRGYKQHDVPGNWSIAPDGSLTTSGEGADLLTRTKYGDFELSLEWKAPEKGNSGIMYRVTEDHDAAWQSGPEYQILDDAGWGDEINDVQSAGSLYALHAPRAGKTLKPAGEWNHARIRVKDGLAQHWLNGEKVVECRFDDDEWRERIAGSKFAGYDGFGMHERGHIALQSHGNPIAFRNIRIRDLDKPMPGEIALFDGSSLDGWTFVSDGSPKEETWSIDGDVLVCKGQPIGFLRTDKAYTNFVLKLEWRFSPVTKAEGNSGVLVRILEDKVWPKSLEGQLMSGSAGDIFRIGEFPLVGEPSRTNGRHTAHSHKAEHEVGEWNDYEIILDGEHFVLIINGDTVNEAHGAEVVPGNVAVQSEGVEIHFRNIRLAPIGESGAAR